MLGYYSKKKHFNVLKKVKTTDYTIKKLTEDMWAWFSNKGATSAVTFQLPAAKVGMGFRFLVEAAYCLTAKPASGESIALPSTGVQSTADYVVEANAVGEMLEIECRVDGDWNSNHYVGTWSARSD